MADDIDIEEHDVLDNPAIKEMFPDILALKEEIKMFEEGVQELVNNNDDELNNTNNTNTGADAVRKEDSNPIMDSSLSDDVVVIEEDISTNISETTSQQDNTYHGNKIILGSKPTTKLEFEEDFFEETVKSYEVNVVLDDLKPYLDTSGRFCKNCLTLFPNKHDLECHINRFHFVTKANVETKEKSDDLKPDDKNYIYYKCNKCNIGYASQSSLSRHNARHHKNIAPPVQGIEEIISNVKKNIKQNQLQSDENVCFHCQKSFPSQQALIEHLYGILQPKKYPCEVCSDSFISSEELKKHTITHKKCVIVVEKVPDQLEHNKSEETHKRPKRIQTKKVTENLSHNETCEREYYYKCYICSYNFTQTKFYVAHLSNKHNIRTDGKGIVKEEFNSKCKYCFNTYGNWQSYNLHLMKCHKEDVNTKLENPDYLEDLQNAENEVNKRMDLQKSLDEPKAGPSPRNLKQDTRKRVIQNNQIGAKKSCDESRPKIFEPLVLKSVLFKCSKCDVHFLSSKVARSHSEHMEMLINWKCLMCKNIFKKEDRVFHEEQHKYSEEFTVHDLCPVTSSPVLYNCPKCAVHFDEDNFLNHYSTCESETPNSVFCIICDILIDNSISKSHRSEHVSKNLKPTDFIIVNSDILEKINYRKLKPKHQAIGKISSISKKLNDNKRKSSETSNIPQKKPNNIDNNILSKLAYCNICKCFLTDIDKQEVHIKEHCHCLEKCICKICGLVLTKESYKTVHKNMHNIMPNMKLNDFRFNDIKSGKLISPPIPEYSKCDTCHIHFISNHKCDETNYLTCHICNINLTEDTFTLHMQFHNYSKTNLVYSTERNEFFSRNSHGNCKMVKGTISVGEINSDASNVFKNRLDSRKAEIISHPVKQHNENKIRNEINSEEKISNNKTKNRNKVSLSSTHIQPQNIKKTPVKQVNHKLVTEASSTEKLNLDGVIYQCKNCCVFVDTYTKVIEHCHGHYCNDEDKLETVKCQICNIMLERQCFEHHKNLHLSHKNKDFFTFLKFDTFYFTSDNRIWIEHVFGMLSSEQRDKIINDSIYKYECRVKMEVIQNGPADLTVYKCDKCRSFINGTSLYKHAENSCFKLRRHPCSVCGLGFNSSVARIEHEKVHERPNINLKSYRIVTFNKEEDKALNKLLYRRSQYHVLYQCRNCSQTVDKSQTGNHNCNGQSLKTCSLCGLLIANDDYDNHVLRHDILPNFIPKNIKIVLFGETLENAARDESNEHLTSFTGIVYDYTFYSCSKCQVCVKTNAYLEKHICCIGTNRLKCSICKLYFVTNRLKQHIKLHETDPDFLKENMRVIMFNAREDVSDNSADAETVTKLIEPAAIFAEESTILNKFDNQCNNDKEFERRPIVITGLSEETIQNGSEVAHKSAKIYKCLCGLHFLEASSILSHFKVCEQKSRAAKQKCAKCDLLFTSDILFDHLILHHGNKSQIYNYSIVDLAMNNIFYRCTKCKLHFANVSDINEHLKFDCGGATEGKDCIFCNLKFESGSFLTHDCNNVKNLNASFEVLDLDEPLVSKSAAARENKLEELKKNDTIGSKSEHEGNEDMKEVHNTSLTTVCENNQEEVTDEPPEQLKMSISDSIQEKHTDIPKNLSEQLDMELPSSTYEINVRDALNNEPGTSCTNKSYESEIVKNQPIQVCITTSSTQSISNEPTRAAADLVAPIENKKQPTGRKQFYSRPYNSKKSFKHEYHNHNQYYNNTQIRPPAPWQKYQNRWHHGRGQYRGHRPRGQMWPVRPEPPPSFQYQNPENVFFDYAREY